MAFLLPLLAPVAAQLTAGVVIGVANAAQAESNVFSVTIGNRVFSTAKPFPLMNLPFELREEILLTALELSRSLCPEPPPPFPPEHPFMNSRHPLYNSPLNPHHPLFVGPTGERELNGYPTSSWRWLRVSREWWAIIRPHLWRDLTLRGPYAYRGVQRLLDDDDFRAIRSFVRRLEVREGFKEVPEVYPILRALPNLDSFTYSPAPMRQYLQPFGVTLIQTNPGPHTLSFNVPFDTLTNPSTRTHLARLQRLHTLRITLRSLDINMASFLASLPQLRTLELVLSILPIHSLNPFAERSTLATLVPDGEVDDDISEPPSAPPSTPPPALTSLIISVINLESTERNALLSRINDDARLCRLITLYQGLGPEQGTSTYTPFYRPAPGTALSGAQVGRSATDREITDHDAKEIQTRVREGAHWERTTRLNMFGGLFRVRLESRR